MVYEKRTMIPSEKLDNVISYFESISNKKEIINEVIYNYHTEGDLRLIRTKDYAKLNFKSNKKENVIYIGKKYEKDLIDMFFNIGISVDFKRFRTRYKYMYEDLYITIDKNMKTGNILRVKSNYDSIENKTSIDEDVKSLFEKLKIEETSLDNFEEAYGKYRTSWADLTKDIDEEEFIK